MQLSWALYMSTMLAFKEPTGKRAPGIEIQQRFRNNGYPPAENDTWVYKVAADSSCRKDSYQLIGCTAATGSLAPGHAWDQSLQLQYTPAGSTEETFCDPLSCAEM